MGKEYHLRQECLTVGDLKKLIKDMDDSIPVIVRRLSKKKGRILYKTHNIRLSTLDSKAGSPWFLKIDVGEEVKNG